MVQNYARHGHSPQAIDFRTIGHGRRGAANTHSRKNGSTLRPVILRYHEPIPCQDGMPHLRDAPSATHPYSSPKDPSLLPPSITPPMRRLKIHSPLIPNKSPPPSHSLYPKSPRLKHPSDGGRELTPSSRRHPRRCRHPHDRRPPRHPLLLDGQSCINRSTRLRGPRNPHRHPVDPAFKTILCHHHAHPRRSVHCWRP